MQQQLLVWSLARFGRLRDVLHVREGSSRLSVRCRPFLEREKSTETKKVSCWEWVLWEIGTVLVLGCSGILVLWYSEGVLMGSDAGCWEESVDGSF